ncbi:hypothetical protein SAMN00790413_01527 [Deinococcus hopiensis KR-140]|uniref:Uncharacterized protein n=1 Tax=Deinococcus hopiensis KR-140 TaxID=695939 RepID=A0A1W1VGI2_9DEIO|nr:hypothetical protein SAMN00790413_01527 [Deinococcus hopiensis KR-140]
MTRPNTPASSRFAGSCRQKRPPSCTGLLARSYFIFKKFRIARAIAPASLSR